MQEKRRKYLHDNGSAAIYILVPDHFLAPMVRENFTIESTNDVGSSVSCYILTFMRSDVIHHIRSRIVICIWQIIISVKTRINVHI